MRALACRGWGGRSHLNAFHLVVSSTRFETHRGFLIIFNSIRLNEGLVVDSMIGKIEVSRCAMGGECSAFSRYWIYAPEVGMHI